MHALGEMVGRIEDHSLGVSRALERIKQLRSARTSLDCLTSLDGYETLDEADLKSLGPRMEEFLGRLRQALAGLEKAFAVRSSFKSIASYFPKESVQSKRFAKLLKGALSAVEALETERDRAKTRLTGAIDRQVESLTAQVKKVRVFAEYQDALRRAIRDRRAIRALKVRKTRLAAEREELRFKLAEVDTGGKADFVVPRFDLPKFELKIANLRAMLSRGANAASGAAEEFLAQNRSVLRERLQYLEAKVGLEREISRLETLVDRGLAKVLAGVYRLSNGMLCFSDSQLSYYFFNMIKTNIVVDEPEFLSLFLDSIRPDSARAFIIFNYSIFNRGDFVERMVQAHTETTADVLRGTVSQSLKDAFVVNFSSLVNLYKDHTRYGLGQPKFLSLGGAFLSSFYYFLGRAGLSGASLGRETVTAHSLGLVAALIVQLVPFLGSVPMINALFVKIFTRVLNFVLTLLMKLFRFTKSQLQPVVDRISECFDSFVHKKYFLDLDYRRVIRYESKLEKEPGAGQSRSQSVDIKDLETVYYKVFQDGHSVLALFQKINVFSPETFLINQKSLSDQDTLETLIQYKLQRDLRNAVDRKAEQLARGIDVGRQVSRQIEEETVQTATRSGQSPWWRRGGPSLTAAPARASHRAASAPFRPPGFRPCGRGAAGRAWAASPPRGCARAPRRTRPPPASCAARTAMPFAPAVPRCRRAVGWPRFPAVSA